MEQKDDRLSEYIDKLNAEEMPKEHISKDSQELNRLFDTVRKVKSLKEPAMPGIDFPGRLESNVKGQLNQKGRKKRKVTFYGLASIAAVMVVFLAGILFSSPNKNIAYAMEEAFEKVQDYHGQLEIVQSNAQGDSITQSTLEVFADKEGRYYVKCLDGYQKGMTTVNNGQKKWQIRPDESQVHIFPAFPDSYRFTFELGHEIENIKLALTTNVLGEEVVLGRETMVLEVSPNGGESYKIWVDKETNLPLKKQYAMQKALQYTIVYSEIEFNDAISASLLDFDLPEGFEEINTNPELMVNSIEEAQSILGWEIVFPETTPEGYTMDSIAILPDDKVLKIYYTKQDTGGSVIIMQEESKGELIPAPMAVIGKVNGNIAEIQSPIDVESGMLGGGLYQDITDMSSVRWKQSGVEYAVIGETSLEDLVLFIEHITSSTCELPEHNKDNFMPKVEVPVDMEVEKNNQKSVESGSSPWLLDNVYVAQVFVSLRIYPEGITDEYPIKYEDLETTYNDGASSIVEVHDSNAPVERVYLKKLIREDSTGIWTVVGYDPRSE